jgi:hypothetical protein
MGWTAGGSEYRPEGFGPADRNPFASRAAAATIGSQLNSMCEIYDQTKVRAPYRSRLACFSFGVGAGKRIFDQ